MSNIVSNNDIMEMFKEIEEVVNNSNVVDDEKQSIASRKQDEIISKLSFLVYNQVKQYRSFPNYEDLVQEGFVGLIKAVRKFDWKRYPNFFVYSDQWIRHYVKRAASRFDVVYSPDKSRVVYDEPDESEIDPSETPDEVLFNEERKQNINKLLDEFPERDREIVKKIFGLNGSKQETLREIGPQFNLTYERVRQIKNNVINKLKKNKDLAEFEQDWQKGF